MPAPNAGHSYTVRKGWLHTAQVAELLGLSPKTVSRHAKEGKLPFQKTLGGHRRYPEAEIRALVAQLTYRVGVSTAEAAARRGEF